MKPSRNFSPVFPRLPGRFSRDWILGLVLLAAVVLAYSPVWSAGFIWDDAQHITRPDLRSWSGLGRIWFHLGATQQYYPLIHSIFWVEHKLWGDGPLGYHLVNILLHAFSAFLLLQILRQLEVPGAWLAAAIFALHPVQVETVAWVTELKNVLSGVFYFGSALFYLEFDRTRKKEAYAAALLLFGLGLLSKSVIATLPAALLVVFWWKRGKLSWKRDVAPLAPFFVVGMVSGLFTAWVERHYIGAEGSNYNYTFIERCLIAGHALCFYVSKLFWPADLIFIYPRWDISEHIWWQYLFPAAVIAVMAVLAWLSRRWRGPLAGFLFFAGSLFPALGFFNVYPFRYSFVADHFQYLACLGIIVPCAAGMALLAEVLIPKKEWLQTSLCAGLLLVLGTLSWQRTWVYQSQDTLWADTLARNPSCWMPHNNLGAALLEKGQVDEAMAQFQKVLEIDPNNSDAYGNLGVALLRKGREDEAMARFQKALEINPRNPEALYNVANVLFARGQVDEAIAQYQKALEVTPDNVHIRTNLGIALLQKGQVDEAIAQYQEALEINPSYAEGHNNLGLALVQKGDMDDAITQFQMAVEINPAYADAHTNLGHAFAQTGQVDEAIAEFQKVLEIDPNDIDAYGSLGIALYRKGRVDEAMAQFQKAVEISPNNANARTNLGIALLQRGQVDEAIAQYQKAVEINPNKSDAYYNLGNALLKKGQVDAAIVEYQKALVIDPGNAHAHTNLGIAFSQKGRMNEAIAQFQEVVRLKPGDSNAQINLAKAQAAARQAPASK